MASSEFTHDAKFYEMHFYVLGSEEIQDESYVNVTNKEIFKGDLPVREGVYDAHMGTTDHAWSCTTCGNTKSICPGHAGSIDLQYPVKSPLFREQLLRWLKIICFRCGKLVTDKEIRAPRPKLLSEYTKICRTITHCAYCNEPHYIVNKDKFRQSIFYITITDTRGGTKRINLMNHDILSIMERVSDDTVKRVGKLSISHPKKFILTTINVAPNTIRPDIRRAGGNRSNSSDITALTKNIVEINELLPDSIPDKEHIDKDMTEKYHNLDMAYYELVKGATGSNNQLRMITSTNKPLNSISNRIPKKEGK